MSNLNKHFQHQFDSNNCGVLPNDVRDDVLADFQLMSHLGIDSDEEQNKFFLVRNHVPELLKLIFKMDVSDKLARLIAGEVYKNQEKKPIDTLLGLIEAIDLALKKMVPNYIRPKVAYPQPSSIPMLPQYDIGRWVDATRKIYGLMMRGQTQAQAKESVIGNWEHMEKLDYETWLRFYKEGIPDKYPKLAFDEDFILGGLPLGALKGKFPSPISSGQGHATKVSPGLVQNLPKGDVDEVRDKIESQRRKLVSRLNSAEKMLASMDGQLFAGDEQEIMLKLLQDLKRKIQIANKRTIKSSLFEDYIYRTANRLKFEGMGRAAGFFYKLAQIPDNPLEGIEDTIGGGLSEPPEIGSNDAPVDSAKGNKQNTHDLLEEFFGNLRRGVDDKNDEKEERDAIEKQKTQSATQPVQPVQPVQSELPKPSPPVQPKVESQKPEQEEPIEASLEPDQIKLGAGFWIPGLESLAQATGFTQPVSQKPIEKGPVEAPDDEEGSLDNTDDVIEAALKNVSINDVVSRLEMLVSIYNQREISRQLAILDIMMDRIGLASFFPGLGEAMSKALEANQYIGSRLEDVLTKVKGSIEVPAAEKWVETSPSTNPETAGIRQRLQQQKQEEDKRRELRKQKDLAKMQGGQVPGGAPSIGEAADVVRPQRIEKSPPLEVR